MIKPFTVFALILAFTLSGCTDSGPAITDHHLSSLRIAYNVLTDAATDNYEVFSMKLDGSDQRNITMSESIEWVYYAFGDKLYFLSDRDTSYRNYFLYEMDAFGENVRQVSNFLVEDSWFSSRRGGSEFVLTVEDSLGRGFYLINNQGNLLAKIFESTYYINDPFFSPDGQSLVFRSFETGIDELWTMNVNGGNLQQLTHYPQDDSSAIKHGYHAGPPFWEPNHNLISYMSKQKYNYSIFTIRPDGSNNKQLTTDEFNQGWHAWSADGKLIAFEGYGFESPNYDIYIMNANGSGIKRLTRDIISEQAPVFVEVSVH